MVLILHNESSSCAALQYATSCIMCCPCPTSAAECGRWLRSPLSEGQGLEHVEQLHTAVSTSRQENVPNRETDIAEGQVHVQVRLVVRERSSRHESRMKDVG